MSESATVSNHDREELRSYDEQFQEAPADDESAVLPDGAYQVFVEYAYLDRSYKGTMMLKWRLRIIDPVEYAGRPIWRTHFIDGSDNLRRLKSDLYLVGLKIKLISELPDQLRRLRDVVLEIRLRTRGEFQNVYFQKRLDGPDPDATA